MNDNSNDTSHVFLVVSQVDPDTLSSIVKGEKTAETYREHGHDIRQVDQSQVAEMLINKPMLYGKLDDDAWEAVSRSLGVHIVDPSGTELPSGLRPTPMDLPSSVAASRLSFLAQYPAKENAKTLVELIEVLRAADEYRAPDPSKFSDTSKAAPSWRATLNGSFDELEAREDAIHKQLNNSDALSRDYSAAMNELSEVNYLLGDHPDNPDNMPGPSM